MQRVYQNASFQIPIETPINKGEVHNHFAYDDFWDAFNLDILNLLNPFGYVYYDLYLNLDHGFGLTHILSLISIVLTVCELKKWYKIK